MEIRNFLLGLLNIDDYNNWIECRGSCVSNTNLMCRREIVKSSLMYSSKSVDATVIENWWILMILLAVYIKFSSTNDEFWINMQKNSDKLLVHKSFVTYPQAKIKGNLDWKFQFRSDAADNKNIKKFSNQITDKVSKKITKITEITRSVRHKSQISPVDPSTFHYSKWVKREPYWKY